MKPKPCPVCKSDLAEDSTEVHGRVTVWEVCDDCGHTRMLRIEEIENA